MRRLWIVPALAALALLPAAALAHGGSEVAVQGEIRPGGGVTITGEEFPAGSVVRLELRKDGGEPVVLGTVTVGGDEAFETTLHVPEGLRPGLFQLVAVGDDESASAEVTVLRAAGPAAQTQPAAAAVVAPPSYDRPASETVALVVLIAAVAALGGLLLWLGRTRPRRMGA